MDQPNSLAQNIINSSYEDIEDSQEMMDEVGSVGAGEGLGEGRGKGKGGLDR